MAGEDDEVREFVTQQLSIAWLGHSTVMLEIDGVRLLTDPLLRRHAWLLRRRFPKPDPDLWRDPTPCSSPISTTTTPRWHRSGCFRGCRS